MMHAVHQKMKVLPDRGLRFIMENEPMENVLGERPDEQSSNKQRNDPGESNGTACAIQKVRDSGNVHNKRDAVMNMREQLKKIAFEQPCRFILVGDEILRHSSLLCSFTKLLVCGQPFNHSRFLQMTA
jgi:hypothetical protein